MAEIVEQPSQQQVTTVPICFTTKGKDETVCQVATVSVLSGLTSTPVAELGRNYKENGLFIWDFQGIAADLFNKPTDWFYPIGGGIETPNDRCIVLSISFTDYNLDLLTGKKAEGDTVTATAIIVCDFCVSYPQNELSPSILGGEAFLTEKPCIELCEGDTEYLSIIGNVTAFPFFSVTYNKAGGGAIGSTVTASASSAVYSVNVGTSNPIINPPLGTAYYLVAPAGAANPLEAGIKVAYNKKCCCDVRLHFINCYSVQDSFSFCDLYRSSKTKSKEFERCLPKSNNKATDVQRGRYNIEYDIIYRAEITGVSSDIIAWLDKTLMSSRAVVWELDGQLVPIVLIDTDSSEFKDATYLNTYSVSFKLSRRQ